MLSTIGKKRSHLGLTVMYSVLWELLAVTIGQQAKAFAAKPEVIPRCPRHRRDDSHMPSSDFFSLFLLTHTGLHQKINPLLSPLSLMWNLRQPHLLFHPEKQCFLYYMPKLQISVKHAQYRISTVTQFSSVKFGPVKLKLNVLLN